jgi:hypothetical protein
VRPFTFHSSFSKFIGSMKTESITTGRIPCSRENPLGLVVLPTDPVRAAYADYLVGTSPTVCSRTSTSILTDGHLAWVQSGGSPEIVEFASLAGCRLKRHSTARCWKQTLMLLRPDGR